MNTPSAFRQPVFEMLAQHLNVPIGHDFMTAKTLIAMIEAVAPEMSKVDQVQLWQAHGFDGSRDYDKFSTGALMTETVLTAL